MKIHDKVKFGNMVGLVVTTSSSKPDYPIQVLFNKEKVVLGFRADGSFFKFGGPKVVVVRQPWKEFKTWVSKGVSNVKLLWTASKVDSSKP